MKKNNNKTVFSVGYYQREQWPILLGSADDRNALEETYDEWILSFKKGLKNMRAAGIEPLRVDVDINELLAWCKTKGYKNTGVYRAEFIAELCRQGRGRRIK
jgi:hypothetical protein